MNVLGLELERKEKKTQSNDEMRASPWSLKNKKKWYVVLEMKISTQQPEENGVLIELVSSPG